MKLLSRMLVALATLTMFCAPATAQTKISALPAATAPTGSEMLPCVQGGVTKQCTAAQIGQNANVLGDGIAAPATNLSYALGGAGQLTGNVTYTVSYITARGETSPFIGQPTALTVNGNQVALSQIPVGPAGTLARNIYRSVTTVSGTKDVRDVYLLTTINDNTTTTFTDNIADTSLGAPANWAARNRAYNVDSFGTVAKYSDQATCFGQQACLSNTGYATTAFGYRALASLTSGRRDTAFGIYAGENVTSGYQNVFMGTHAGNGVTTGASNTLLGYAAGGTAGITVGNFNTGVGGQALGSNTLTGNGNTALGYLAGAITGSTVSYNLSVGPFTGRYSTGNFNIFIDSYLDRGTLTAAQTNGWMYGVAAASPTDQRAFINAATRLGSSAAATVAALAPCAAATQGFHAYVTDATVAYSGANLGTTVAGGGTNFAPVICGGTNWMIGG